MKFNLIMASLLLSTYATATSHAAQQITIKNPVFDFGSVPQGQKVEHTYIIRNSGDKPLSIRSVRPSCGCTAAQVSTPLVQPGRITEIKVTFNSSHFNGAIRKTIVLETDDPKAPIMMLTLQGLVTEEITVTPRQIDLGFLKFNATRETHVTVINNGKRLVKLVSVSTPFPEISAKLNNNIIKRGESVIITIVASAPRGPRIFSVYLTKNTDNPVQSDIFVPIYASISR